MGEGLKRARRAAADTRLPLRDKLIAAGVRNLKVYGYPNVTNTNILTDHIYKAFFVSMLKDNYGKGADDAIDALLKELANDKS